MTNIELRTINHITHWWLISSWSSISNKSTVTVLFSELCLTKNHRHWISYVIVCTPVYFLSLVSILRNYYIRSPFCTPWDDDICEIIHIYLCINYIVKSNSSWKHHTNMKPETEALKEKVASIGKIIKH